MNEGKTANAQTKKNITQQRDRMKRNGRRAPGNSNGEKKDKRHRANRQKLTRKRTDGHKRENI